MGAYLNPHVLLAAWRQGERSARWGRLGFIALSVALLTAVVWLVPTRAKLPIATIVLSMLVLGIWGSVITSLLEQNHPILAKIVPGHVEALRHNALAAWLLVVLLSAGALRLGFPMLPLPAGALLAALVAAYIAWALRNWAMWFVVWLGPTFLAVTGLGRQLQPLWQAGSERFADQPWVYTGLGLMAMGWGITQLFGEGDSAHAIAYARQARMRVITRLGMSGAKPTLAMYGRWGERVSAPIERAASAWLAHLIRHANPTQKSVMARAEVVLHGSQHWLRQALNMLMVFAWIAVFFTIAVQATPMKLDRAWTGGALGIAVGLATMGFSPAIALGSALWASRREQALLLLLPGMPQGRALNRAVAWRQTRQLAVAWALTAALMFALSWLSGDWWLACLCVVGLPMGLGWLLRAPARLRAPTSWTAILPLLLYMGASLSLYHLVKTYDLPFAPICALGALAAAAVGWWRWHRLMAAPSALPAGRSA